VIQGVSLGLAIGPAGNGPEQLKQVTEEFESIFLEMLLRSMRQSARSISGEKTPYARDIYESWQDQAFARSIAGAGGIGLAATLYRQLSEGPALKGR
jgi:peptidoglycan hydrolase FlgJ